MEMKALIDDVKEIADGWGEALEPPAMQSEIDALQEAVKATYKVELPAEYMQLLRLVNGLEFNGLIIYGTKNSISDPDASPLDLMAMNAVLRESQRMNIPDTIIIGEDSTGVLTYERQTGQFQYRDRIAPDRVEPYRSFTQMLAVEIDKMK